MQPTATSELWVKARGVNIPTFQIEQLRSEFGAMLVGDEEFGLLLLLDKALAAYRMQHGKDPDCLIIREDPMNLYKHCFFDLNVPMMGRVEVKHKPLWFRIKRSFRGVGRG